MGVKEKPLNELDYNKELTKKTGWNTYTGENLSVSYVTLEDKVAFVVEVKTTPWNRELAEETVKKYFKRPKYAKIP